MHTTSDDEAVTVLCPYTYSQSGGHLERRLSAIFAADIVGYSHFMGIDEAGTIEQSRDG